MAHVDMNGPDHRNGAIKELFVWSFKAEKLDKRLARSLMLIISLGSVVATVGVMVASFF